MLARGEALKLVERHVSKRMWVNHMLAVEAIMRGLASRLGGDEEEWGLLGLLHDIDFEETEKDAGRHALVAADILRGKVSERVIRAVQSHNHEHTGVTPSSPMEKALIAADAVSGLIIASALVMPSKRLREVSVRTLEKKFKQKDFARRADRGRIQFYEKLGMSREEFFQVSLDSLKGISGSLGL